MTDMVPFFGKKEHRIGRISVSNSGKRLTIWFKKTGLYSLLVQTLVGLKLNTIANACVNDLWAFMFFVLPSVLNNLLRER